MHIKRPTALSDKVAPERRHQTTFARHSAQRRQAPAPPAARTGRTGCKPRGLPRNVQHSGRPGRGGGERLSGTPRRDCLGGADWPAPWIGRLRAGFADRTMVRQMAAGAGLTGQKIQRGVLKALALRIWPSPCNGAGHGSGGSSRARYFAGGKIGIPRHGCKTSRSRSLDTIVLAWAASANSRYLLSALSRQSVTVTGVSNQWVPDTSWSRSSAGSRPRNAPAEGGEAHQTPRRIPAGTSPVDWSRALFAAPGVGHCPSPLRR